LQYTDICLYTVGMEEHTIVGIHSGAPAVAAILTHVGTDGYSLTHAATLDLPQPHCSVTVWTTVSCQDRHTPYGLVPGERRVLGRTTA